MRVELRKYEFQRETFPIGYLSLKNYLGLLIFNNNKNIS